jgi:hypothetical protein
MKNDLLTARADPAGLRIQLYLGSVSLRRQEPYLFPWPYRSNNLAPE